MSLDSNSFEELSIEELYLELEKYYRLKHVPVSVSAPMVNGIRQNMSTFSELEQRAGLARALRRSYGVFDDHDLRIAIKASFDGSHEDGIRPLRAAEKIRLVLSHLQDADIQKTLTYISDAEKYAWSIAEGLIAQNRSFTEGEISEMIKKFPVLDTEAATHLMGKAMHDVIK